VSDQFRVVQTERLLDSFVFNVERRTVDHDGHTFERDVVTHLGAVAILAINDHDEVGFLRQYRATFDRYDLEIPAGTLDVPGEDTLDAARRELLEELGCEAEQWTLLGRFMVSPGWSDQLMTIYEARQLTQRERRPMGPEERTSTVLWLSKEALRSTLRDEGTLDATMVVALHRVFGSFFDVD
jgi:ADP-ribose pyrophosphatase